MTNGSATYNRLLLLVAITEIILWGLFGISLMGDNFLMGSYTWLHPEYFWLLISIPILLGASILHWTHKDKLATTYGTATNTSILQIRFKTTRAFLHYLLLRSVFFFTVLALAQPVLGSKKVKGSQRVLDLVICLDVSNSMNVKDMSGDISRLNAAKNALMELLNGLHGERISLIIFANEAFTQLPLTQDIGAAKLFVPDIETNMVYSQGTNIGAAFELAKTQFKDEEAGRAILVITDGEDHEEAWKKNVRELAEKNVQFSYLGLGTETGGPVPKDPAYPEMGYKSQNGTTVVSRLNRSGIKAMASNSGGSVSFSSSGFPDLRELVKEFNSSKNKTIKEVSFDVAKNYYYIPLILAIACFILYLFLPHLVNRNA